MKFGSSLNIGNGKRICMGKSCWLARLANQQLNFKTRSSKGLIVWHMKLTCNYALYIGIYYILYPKKNETPTNFLMCPSSHFLWHKPSSRVSGKHFTPNLQPNKAPDTSPFVSVTWACTNPTIRRSSCISGKYGTLHEYPSFFFFSFSFFYFSEQLNYI